MSGQSQGMGGGAACLHPNSALGVSKSGLAGLQPGGWAIPRSGRWSGCVLTWVTRKALTLLPKPRCNVKHTRATPCEMALPIHLTGMWCFVIQFGRAGAERDV